MNKIFLVCKAYYLSFFGINKALHSKDKNEKSKTFITLIGFAFLGLIIFGASFLYSAMIGSAYLSFGRPEALIAMMMAASSVICLFTTSSKGCNVLFTSSDYNIIMALPIKTTDIIVAKLIVLYGMNLMFTLFVMIPATIVFGVLTAASVIYYPIALIMMLFIPIVPMIMGTVISIIIGVFAGHFRHKNIITSALILVFLLIVMFGSFSFTSADPGQFINIGNTIIATIYKIYPLTEMYTIAVSSINILNIISFVGICAAVGILFSWIVGHKFTSILTFLKSSKSKSNFKMRELKNSRPINALYVKEIKRYIASPVYVVNTALGPIMLIAAGVLSVVSKDTLMLAFADQPMILSAFNVLTPMIISVLVSMTNTTAVSISLEGKSLGIVKSLPIRTIDVFLAKIFVNLTLTIPSVLIAATLLSIAFKPGLFIVIMSFLIPIVYCVFSATFGILVNLVFPTLEWTNETAVVKQSTASVVGILGGMAIAVLLTTAVGFLQQFGLIIVLAAVILATVLLFVLLKNWGQKKFLQLL